MWRDGSFVPGASLGVVGAELQARAWPRQWYTLTVTVLSGQYAFLASDAGSAAYVSEAGSEAQPEP